MQKVRAIYHDGVLELLESVDLENGEQIEIEIPSAQDKAIALKMLLKAQGLLVDEVTLPEEDEMDDEIALNALHASLHGGLSLSEIVMEEREQGW